MEKIKPKLECSILENSQKYIGMEGKNFMRMLKFPQTNVTKEIGGSEMSRKKKFKKILKKVIATFDNLEGLRFDKTIEIPDGWKFKFGFAEQPRLVDEGGNVRKIFEWKAGFSATYEFFY
jgi:hypothetical protein